MLIKIVILLFLLVIIYSLGSAFFFLAKDRGRGDRLVRRLSWRIGLSILLLALIWVAVQSGWIEPNSGPIRPAPLTQPEQ